MRVKVLTLLPPKKRAKLRFPDLAELAVKEHGDSLEFIEVERARDLEHWIASLLARDLEEAKVVVLHKITELLVEDPEGIELVLSASRRWHGDPRVRFVDDPEVTLLLTDRLRICQALSEVVAQEFIPPFKLPETIVPSSPSSVPEGLFPAIVKPLDACTTEHAHLMHLVAGREDYERIAATLPPHLLQRYIPHRQALYKIYLIGSDHMNIVVRPSVPPLTNSFDSQHLRHQPHLQPGSQEYAEAVKRVAPLEGRLRAISHLLSTRLLPDHPLTLFGWDLIIGEEDDELYVVDVNFFPGYDGAPDFHHCLLRLLLSS